MLSIKSVIKLSVVVGIISWVALVITDLIILFSVTNDMASGIPAEIPKLLLDLFFVSVFVFYKFSTPRAESVNFVDLIWRVFVVGLVATIVLIVIKFFFASLGDSMLFKDPMTISFFYHIILGLISAFLISTFTVWQRLILYQRSKNLNRAWDIFQYSVLASILFNFTPYNLFDIPFNVVLLVLVLFGVLLMVNLKWIAYLNLKQKWKTILLLLFILIYLSYFLTTLFQFDTNNTLQVNLLNNLFSLVLFAFVFLYAIFSLLVILFNLPTSSVFQQKLGEVVNFQKLSQSGQTGQKEERVLEILLDSSYSAVLADAAWLEIVDEQGQRQNMLTRKIDTSEIERIKQRVKKTKVKNILDGTPEHDGEFPSVTANFSGLKYKSILAFPLMVQNRQVGFMALLKEVEDGFNKEAVDIVNTFGNQASISIENFRLLSVAIDNERYKEELKIAKRVQRSLLPQKAELNAYFDLSAFSESADEVGGDYYDFYTICENKVALIIGDVSGKGTSAAFNMSQMKGVFHSLAQLDLSPKDFLVKANNALSSCLEKTSFITASYFVVNIEDKTIESARAGHCPTLFYDTEAQRSYFFESKGLGLGILRNLDYHKYVQVNRLNFRKGDIMVLYTDGIIEAKNEAGEEYGYERLQAVLNSNCDKTPREIEKALIQSVYKFCEGKILNDDYTTVIIKFY